MSDTWGIPGPVFTWIYLGLVLLPAAAAAIATVPVLAGRRATAPLSRIDEVAMLAGGPNHLADTVITTLLAQEKLRMASNGRLHRTSDQTSGELGQAVLETIGTGTASVDRIRISLRSYPAVVTLVDDLVERRLLVDPRALRQIWAFATAVYVAVIVVGFARLIIGSAKGHPVGYLLALLVLAIVAAVVTTKTYRRPFDIRSTSAGRAAVKAADPGLVHGELGAVALGGLARHPDKNLGKAASPKVLPRRRRRFASGGAPGMAGVWSAGAYSGGASCGGGGGGCGGGGGGGGCGG